MSDYLVHGLWLPVSGLSLWIEKVEGHKVVVPSNVPSGTFPPAVEALLEKRSFRNRARVSLRTPKGKNVSLMVPLAMYAPEEAMRVLEQLSFLTHRSPAATDAQRATIAPDLMWLIHAYKGLSRFVKAGRVTIRLAYQGGEWYPMWQLASGLGERSWLAEMVSAAPGVLVANNRSLSEDMANEMVHWITFSQLQHLTTVTRPYPWHEFADALLTTRPIKRGRAQLLRALNEWKDSITSVDLQLVFIVEEPPQEEAFGEQPEEAAEAAAVWPVRVRVRSGTDSPMPVKLAELDPSSVEKLQDAHRRAAALAPQIALHKSQPAPVGAGSDSEWDVYLETPDLVDFVGTSVEKLKAAGFTVMLPRAWAHMETTAKLETHEVRDPAVAATKSHLGMDKLMEYNWRLSVGNHELSDEEMQRLVNSKSGLIRLRGEWVMADTSALSRIQEYMDELAKKATARKRKEVEKLAAKAARAKEMDLPGWQLLEVEAEVAREKFNQHHADSATGELTVAELRQLALESMAKEPIEFTGSTWHSSLIGGMNTQAPERIDIPDTVHAELREYQRRGVDWLYWMSRNNVGAVLADDMGLGKTLQLLTLLAVEHDRNEAIGPTLVIVPTSVVGNWAREATKFVPSLKVLVQHGAHRLKDAQLVEAANSHDLVITSYGTVARDFNTLSAVDWDRVVLDEAQAIKNSTTRSSKAVRAIPARQRIALTGTPVENRLSEMRSILDFCNPGVLGSANFFRNHFAKAIERENDEVMAERLRLLTAPFIMRRLKTDPTIIDDLPEKSEQIITVNMTPEQASLYKALVDDVQKRLEETHGITRRGLVLSSLTRIKQICNHPAHYLGDGSAVTLKGHHRSGKVAELMRIVDEAATAGEKVLVFTQYKAFGDILQPYLSAQFGRDIPFLHGGVTKSRRDSMVTDFQESEDGAPAMILSLKAGGTGLNLTAANVVVHMDRWWNPAVENQATDRAFRIGQQRNVQVYKMITAGTLEESIQDILDGKMHLAGAVVGEGEGWLTELDADQLAELMSYRGADPGADRPGAGLQYQKGDEK